MKIGIGLANSDYMCLSSFDADLMLYTIENFSVVFRYEFFNTVDIARVANFLIIATDERIR